MQKAATPITFKLAATFSLAIAAIMALSSVGLADIYTYKVKDIDGKDVDLGKYRGKVALIVNTASKCGFTPQYSGLQELFDEYEDQGFVVLGFPSNDFGNQEPGSNAEIKAFCTERFNVSFPMFGKVAVKGDDQHPLYKYLTEKSGHEGEVSWNFNKFLVGPNGKVVARYGSMTSPTSKKLKEAIEEQLADVKEKNAQPLETSTE